MVFQRAADLAYSSRDLFSRTVGAAMGYIERRREIIAAEDAKRFDPGRRNALATTAGGVAAITAAVYGVDALLAGRPVHADSVDDKVLVGYYKIGEAPDSSEVQLVSEEVFTQYDRLSAALGKQGEPLTKKDLKAAKQINEELSRGYRLIYEAKRENVRAGGGDVNGVVVAVADIDEAKEYAVERENVRFALDKLRYVDPANPGAALSPDDQAGLDAVNLEHAQQLEKINAFHQKTLTYHQLGDIDTSQLRPGLVYKFKDPAAPKVRKFSGREADLYVNALIKATVLKSASDVKEGVAYTLTKAQADAFNVAVNPTGNGINALVAGGGQSFEIAFRYVSPNEASRYATADIEAPAYDAVFQSGHINPAEAAKIAESIAAEEASGRVVPGAPTGGKRTKIRSGNATKPGGSGVKKALDGTGKFLRKAGQFLNPFD